MTSNELLHQLILQVNNHNFNHLYKNKKTGHAADGWAGGLTLYSPNALQPAPAAHFAWLSDILQKISEATTPSTKVQCANNILQWGGMNTIITDDDAGHDILTKVISSARNNQRVDGAPMNSSYTKIAAVFGYNFNNTIWDSRVSTAICFRLACIMKDSGTTMEEARVLFPDLGFVAGMSARVKKRLPLIQQYWPNVYQSWKGHFSGARVLSRIATLLNAQPTIPCPSFGYGPGTGPWTPWKVNMVFFVDDITNCPSQGLDSEASIERLSEHKHEPKRFMDKPSNFEILCGHRVINQHSGIHFEPKCITGPLNDADALGLPVGKHGLGRHRILLEFFRMQSGRCKISARVRIADPSFDKLLEAAIDAGCPMKKEGIDITDQTNSIFVFPLQKIPKGDEMRAVRDFTCKPELSYKRFLQALPTAMRPPY